MKAYTIPYIILFLLVPQLHGVTIGEIENLDVISPELTASSIVAFGSDGASVVAAVDSNLQVLKSLDNGESWTRAGKITEPVGIPFPRITDINFSGTNWVATGNFRSVSADLETWDSGSISIITSLGATYGFDVARGRFVAVGQGSKIRYSDDGFDWETADPPTEIGFSTLSDVDYGGRKFVAVSHDGHIIVSQDGINWTTSLDGIPGLTGSDDQFTGVRYVRGVWFATGLKGLLMVSDDAETWDLLDTGVEVDAVDLDKPILRKDGLYAFSFQNTARFLISDLITFSVFESPNGVEVYHTTQVGKTFAGASSLGTFAFSEDGEKWVTTGERLGGTFTDIEFGDGKFFITDDDNGKIFSSPDGRNWTFEAEVTEGTGFQGPLTKGPTGIMIRMTNNNYLYRENGASSFEVVSTFDLNDDTGLPLPVGILQSANGLWFGFDLFGDQVAYSADLENWTLVENLPGRAYYSVAFGNGTYALVGQGNPPEGGDIATSTDLITWTDRTPGLGDSFTEVTFDGNRFLTKSTKPYVSSTSGPWEIQSTAPTIGRRKFLQSAEIGTISFGLTGRLAINDPADPADEWDIISFPSTAAMNDGVEGNGIFVGVGDDGMVLASPILGPEYQAWVLTYFGANPDPLDTGPYSDPEGDGILNIEEYARGTDPINPTQPIEINISNVIIDPFQGIPYSGTLVFEKATGITEVDSVVEYSEDLKLWRTDGVVLSESPSGANTTVTATLEGSIAAPPLFMRVSWLPASD